MKMNFEAVLYILKPYDTFWSRIIHFEAVLYILASEDFLCSGCDAVQFGRNFPTFPKNMPP